MIQAVPVCEVGAGRQGVGSQLLTSGEVEEEDVEDATGHFVEGELLPLANTQSAFPCTARAGALRSGHHGQRLASSWPPVLILSSCA